MTGVSATNAIQMSTAAGDVARTFSNSSAVPASIDITNVVTHEGGYSSATALPDGRVSKVGGIGRGPQYVVGLRLPTRSVRRVLFDPRPDQSHPVGSSAHAGSDALLVLPTGAAGLRGNTSRISIVVRPTPAAEYSIR